MPVKGITGPSVIGRVSEELTETPWEKAKKFLFHPEGVETNLQVCQPSEVFALSYLSCSHSSPIKASTWRVGVGSRAMVF